MDPYETGIVVEDDVGKATPRPTNFTTESQFPVALPKALFFSRIHFDIFGLFFPIDVPDVQSAIVAVTDVYRNVGTTKGDLIAHVTSGNDVIALEKRRKNASNSSTSSVTSFTKSKWPEVYTQNSETLER